MKLSTKRALDHYVGNFGIFCLSGLVRLAGRLLGRSHEILPVDSIVIMKFQGIGSLAMAVPAIRRLRARLPAAHIAFWGAPATSALARELEVFDEVLTLDDRSLGRALASGWRCLRRIHRLSPDWTVDMEVYSKLSVLLCTLTLGRNRTGFAVDSVRLRRMNHTHLVFFNRHHYLGYAYERLLGLLDPGGTRATPASPGAGGLLPPMDDAGLPEWQAKGLPFDGPYIAINPNAGDLCLERRWPIERFAALIEGLLTRYPESSIVLLGAGVAEAAHTRRLVGHPRVHDLVDRLSLRDAIRCIQGARLVVSNDSAPLHFALLSEVPVVGLFGPTHPSTYVDGTRPRTRIHYTGLFCSPCVHYWEPLPCKGWNQCMLGIAVEDVLRSCEELLADPPPNDWRLIAGSQPWSAETYYPGLVYSKGTRGGDAGG